MKRQENVMRDYVQNVCCDRRNEIKNGWTFKLNKKKNQHDNPRPIYDANSNSPYQRFISDFTSFAWHM